MEAIDPNDIAVIGMSCRFPQANSAQEYWNILKNGLNTSASPPQNRLLLTPLDETIRGNFLKCAVDEFDASFFGMSPNEARFTDPQSRLSLELSWEALEDAGINPEAIRGSETGVFIGTWTQDYKDLLNLETGSGENFFRKYMGNGVGCTAAKLSYFFGLRGPNLAFESGCSSAIMAVHFACKSILRGECPLAIACGANIILQWNDFMVFAPDGKSKTFDADTNGYGRGEGIGVLVLKKLSEAILDGDKIHGVIKGSFAYQEGLSKNFGTPTVECESIAMKGAMDAAKVCPSQVDYVEAHATGTARGDPLEAASIVEAYTSSKKREAPLYIASGKTNIGHTEACSGIAGIIKVILAMKHELIPPHINLEKLNPKVNFDSIPGQIPVELVPWKRNSSRPRVAGVSGFGISGTNVHMIIQEPPLIPTSEAREPGKDKIPLQIVTLSAKTEYALNDATNLLQEHLRQSSDELVDIAFTANNCRAHHPFRRSLVGADTDEIIEKILTQNWISGNISQLRNKSSICFTFPGIIGGFELEPVRVLYETCSVFRLNMDNCNAVAEKVSGVSFLPIPSDYIEKSRTFYFLSILAVPYSLVKLWEYWGVTPDVVMGHCVGELIAAVSSGAIDLEDAFGILNEILLKQDQDQPASSNSSRVVMAINQNVEAAKLLLLEFEKISGNECLEITADNSKHQTLVAGTTSAVENFNKFCVEKGIRCKQLPNEGGVLYKFHSKEIEPILNQCKDTSAWQMTHRAPKIKYISSVTGTNVQEFTEDYWYNCFRQPIQFSSACEASKNMGCNIYLEMGQSQALNKLIAENIGNEAIFLSSSSKSEHGMWEGLLRTLGLLYVAGYQINWNSFYENITKKKVNLTHYPFQRKSYWLEQKVTGSSWRQGKGCQNFSKITEPLHPLLGNHLEFAVSSGNEVYENQLSTNCATYIADHVIGNKIIFPGAGFMDMLLSAGAETMRSQNIENNLGSFCIENLTISSALQLNDDMSMSSTTTQTIVDKDSSKISIFSRDDGPKKEANWKLHASGFLFNENHHEQQAFDLSTKFKQLELQEEKANTFYNQVASAGLNFGPQFKSLRNIRQGNGETLAEVTIPEDSDKYLIHPILLDAMLQCYILHSIQRIKKLYVPVRVSKIFTFQNALKILQSSKSNTVLIHCKTEKETGQVSQVTLLDLSGSVLCRMISPEMAATTVEAVIRSAQVNLEEVEQLPSFYNINWKKCPKYKSCGSQNYFDMTSVSTIANADVEEFHDVNDTSLEKREMDKDTNGLCTFYVIKALYELGWRTEDANMIKVEQLIDDLKIIPSLTRAFKHYLTFLVEHGFLIPANEMNQNGGYLILKDIFPPKEQVDAEIKTICKKLSGYKCLPVLQACGDNIAAALQGTVAPQYILFGEQEKGPNLATIFYTESWDYATNFRAMTTMLSKILRDGQPTGEGKRVLRVLEVGAGTGSFTNVVVETIERAGADFEYYFTDISPSFVAKAEKQFAEKYGNNFTFTAFDLEKDGLKQQIPPNYFDLIIAADVLHATRVLRRTLSNLRMHLREGGRIFISETNIPMKEIDIVFGLLEGYWRFEDDDMRPFHCTIPTKTWRKLLENTGFSPSSITQALCCNGQKAIMYATKGEDSTLAEVPQISENNVWTIFHDGKADCINYLQDLFKNTKRKAVSVNLRTITNIKNDVKDVLLEVKDNLEGILYVVTDTFNKDVKQQFIVDPFLHVLQFILQSKLRKLPKLILVTTGVWDTGNEHWTEGLNPAAATLWGMMRSAGLEIHGLKSKSIDLDSSAKWSEILEQQQLRREIWMDDKEPEVAYRQSSRLLRRLENEGGKVKKPLELQYPLSPRYVIECPQTKLISDLKLIQKEPSSPLLPHQVQIKMRATSLNFRDVLTIMKPANFPAEAVSTIGYDFGGVVSALGTDVIGLNVGDSVFGCSFNESAVSSHITASKYSVAKMPNHLTFAEAATLPTVFLTAWYCMVNIGNLKAGQTLLVHAASGGVGLIAIQVAKILGVTVIGTAGNERKRQYLRSLGVEHVFSSRTLEFGEKIKKLMNGHRGVDMVLNCLTGKGFKEASLDVIRDEGSFVEISKMDIFTTEEVHQRRPDVKYTIVDLKTADLQLVHEVMSKQSELLEKRLIQPLPFTRFPASGIINAVTFLQKAKHIGKVVIEMPLLNPETNIFEDKLFNDKSSYLITGGRGAMGLAIAEWMVKQGAKYLILVGRSPPTKQISKVINKLEGHGAQIFCEECDISSVEQCQKMLMRIKNDDALPPLRGIHHCAVVLSDKMIGQQDWKSFELSFGPKLYGAWNLHTLTQDYHFEFFVVHSSISSILGNLGQSNYCGANAYLDSLIDLRQSLGLPGTTINWGQWDAGIAKDLYLEMVLPMPISLGISALNKIMRENITSVVAGNVDLAWYSKRYPDYSNTLFQNISHMMKSELEASKGSIQTTTKNTAKTAVSLRKLLEGLENEGEIQKRVEQFIESVVRGILGLRDGDKMDPTLNFQEMGMDSLMTIDFTNRVQSELGDGIQLGFVDMEDFGTVEKMSELLMTLLKANLQEGISMITKVM